MPPTLCHVTECIPAKQKLLQSLLASSPVLVSFRLKWLSRILFLSFATPWGIKVVGCYRKAATGLLARHLCPLFPTVALTYYT